VGIIFKSPQKLANQPKS